MSAMCQYIIKEIIKISGFFLGHRFRPLPRPRLLPSSPQPCRPSALPARAAAEEGRGKETNNCSLEFYFISHFLHKCSLSLNRL